MVSCSYRGLLSWRLGPDWLFCCLAHIDDRAVQALVREPEWLTLRNTGSSNPGDYSLMVVIGCCCPISNGVMVLCQMMLIWKLPLLHLACD